MSHFDFRLQKNHQSDEEKLTVTLETTLVSTTLAKDSATKSASLPASVSTLPFVVDNDSSVVSLSVNLGTDDRKVPGVDSTSSLDEIQESHDASHSSILELNETSQEHVTGLGNLMPSNVSSTEPVPTDVTEAQSNQVVNFHSCQATSTVSLATSFQHVLPKMTVIDANLTDEAKDQLEKEAFIRVIDAYKQVAISGGLDSRFSLLGHLGIEV